MSKDKGSPRGEKDARKRDIAIAGLKAFCEKGYAGTTIEDIVKKAGCSHGLFYHYFKNKKEVFDETMRIRREKSDDDMEKQLSDQPDYGEKLRIIINNMFYNLKNDENFVYFYYFFVSQCFTGRKPRGLSAQNGNEGAAARASDGYMRDEPCREKKHEPPIVKFERLFREGQEKGYFTLNHSAKECAILFSSIIQGATLGYVIAPREVRQRMSLPDPDFIISIFRKENI